VTVFAAHHTRSTARQMRFRTRCTAALLLAVVLPDGPTLASEPPASAPADAPPEAWPVARGVAAGTGRSAATLSLPLATSWKREFAGTAFGAVPVIGAGTVYIGDLDGTFHALSLDTGETRWTFRAEAAGFPASAAVSTDPAVPLVVVGDDAGLVRALDMATGEVRWTHETSGEISGGPTIFSSPEGPRVLVGSQDASLACLAIADGTVVWTHSIADQIRCSPTVVQGGQVREEAAGLPEAAGDVVLIAGCDGKLHVIDAATGGETASVPIDGPTGTTPAAASGRVYFGTEGGTFFAIDVPEAREIWRMASVPPGQSYRSSAALVDDLAIVGSRGRAVEAFALTDGTRRWRQPMRGRVDAAPVVVGVRGGDDLKASPAAIVADSAGTIVVLDAATGDRRWQFDAGAGFTGGPAVAAGRVVIASDRGTVWCFTGTARHGGSPPAP
jgi:outer membrane protein assembly factor BamB